MFDRLRGWIKGKENAEGARIAKPPAEIPVIPPEENPSGIALLGVRPVTQSAIALSTEESHAANSVSYGQEDGRVFADQAPESATRSDLNLRYRIDRVLAEGPLFIPNVMDQKWALFYFNS